MCYNYVSDNLTGYDDWFLPSINELEEIYKVFEPNPSSGPLMYWSSTISSSSYDSSSSVWIIDMSLGSFPFQLNGIFEGLVRPIRAFGDWSSYQAPGCTDENASNFQLNADIDDNTCCYNCYFTNTSEFYGKET